MFSGLSSLRAAERKAAPASEKSKAMQAYLAAQYGAGDAGAGGEGEKKKKKKKKRADAAVVPGLKIMDQDVSGFAAVGGGSRGGAAASAGRGPPGRMPQLHVGDDDEEDDDQPVLVNPEEAERLRVLAEREKQFYRKGEDGSGWAVTDKGRAAAEQDASPPRRGGRQRHDSPDASPPRRQRHDSPDASPPRRQRHDSADASPPRRRAAAAADASPPRRQRHDSPDASPPRRQRHDSPDASPPRKQRHDSPDASLPRRRAAAVDASPPRRQRHDSPDASPPRRRQPSADASPPRRRADSRDASPPRRQRGAADAAADASPPRKRRGEEDEEMEGAEAKRRKMMSDGTIAGMVSGRELMEEMKKKRERERQRFADLDADVTGRGAQTVFRDREGRRVSKEEFLEQQAAAKKKAQYDSEAALEWGGGLKQRADAAERAAAMAAEAAKPFARSADDAELDAMHRRRSRWGDPMAGLVKPKLPELEAPSSLVERHAAKLKKSGFIIPQETPKHSWLRRGVGAPPNRYGIKPGRHWDGVDRGNGFERDMFKRQNELKRQAQEAYMWAQEDM